MSKVRFAFLYSGLCALGCIGASASCGTDDANSSDAAPPADGSQGADGADRVDGASSDANRSSDAATSADGNFATPNILDNASFETDWNGFTDWSGNPPPTGDTLSRATDYAHTGSYSARRTWTPNPGGDTGSQFLYHIGGTDRVWLRFYFRLTVNVTTVMKFARFYDTSFATSFGGFYLGAGKDIFAFGTDEENGSITTYFGLSESRVIDGNWHSLEIDYWRNGDPSGFPSAAFWFDGTPVSMADGTDVMYAGAGNSSYWSGGRLYSGVRSSSGQIGYIEWLATLNGGNTTTGQVNIDDVSMSTVGRIGP